MNLSGKVDMASYRLKEPGDTLRLRKAVLETLFEAWTRINAIYLKIHPEAPNLYQSGVKYRRDPERRRIVDSLIGASENEAELWLDIPSILDRGYDDCEGLACYLAAELRVRSKNSLGVGRRAIASCVLKPVGVGKWHAVTCDPATGQCWDPSAKLGMYDRRRDRA